MKEWAMVPLRAGLGIMFLAHGLQKAFGLFGGPGIEGVTKMVESLGFSPPVLWAYALAYTELLGGLFLVIGLYTRISSAALLFVMIMAAVKVQLAHGFFLATGGVEYVFVVMAVCVSLIMGGGGRLCITKKL